RCHIPNLESLEIRITPTTRTWLGVDGNNWSDALNWVGNVAPSPGDDLVFAASAANSHPSNDFAAGTTFGSITISSADYVLSGNQVKLSHGISATYSSGTTIDHIDTVLLDGTVSVGAGGELDLLGTISGTAGLTFSGGGTLTLGGSTVNSYTGST